MKKLGLTLVMAMMVMMFVVGEAWALLYTPSLDNIADWELVYATDNSGVSGGSSTVLGSSENDVKTYSKEDDRPYADLVKFDVTFEKGSSSYKGGVAFGSITAQDLSGFDSYSLSIYNSNENPWEYALWVGNYDNGTYSVYHTTPVSLANGSGQQFTLDLLSARTAGIDLTNAYIGFAVGSDSLPLGSSHPDFHSQTHVAPVPEPGTMVLLGVGLLGLAFVGRKKLKIEE
ncbi:MAG: PEP-CTERM sorting domain-containing protein [Deltaproteobacteria bacterium]|nr:PEP-CTERM sorting domain-containing protein [Deltaproteobacteria bacterium]